MATALQVAQDTCWTAPSSERVWSDIFKVVKQAFCHQPDRFTKASGPVVPEAELRDMWNCVKESTAFLTSVQPHEVLDTSTFPLSVGSPFLKPFFVSSILSAMDQEPVEDGYEHPAERVIEAALFQDPEGLVMWLRFLVSQEKNSSIVASVIACFARLNESECLEGAYDFVAQALQHQDVEVRDAAAQALELWGTPAALHLLRTHDENVPWLRAYIERVVGQLNRE